MWRCMKDVDWILFVQAFLPDASGLPVESTSTSVPDSDPETDTPKTVEGKYN